MNPRAELDAMIDFLRAELIRGARPDFRRTHDPIAMIRGIETRGRTLSQVRDEVLERLHLAGLPDVAEAIETGMHLDLLVGGVMEL